ncbi:acyl-CoA N-acyltransferase [Cyathus striatus]|nr:acyl-CoA N-acyltransferase [Cyathus striatus]
MNDIPAVRRLQAISQHTTSNSSNHDGKLVLVLPDGDRVTSVVSPSSERTTTQLFLNGRPLVTFQEDNSQQLVLEITPVNTRYQGATTHIPKYNLIRFSAPEGVSSTSVADFWVIIYALFTIYHVQEHIPSVFEVIPSHNEIVNYLLESGLGRTNTLKQKEPVSNANSVIYLSRAAFWQGAGTTGFHHRSWLLSPSTQFPALPSFTRDEKVITAHPLRPKKPQPGQVIYRRYCADVAQILECIYFDLEGETDGTKASGAKVSSHMAAFHKWHNDPRVNIAWKEQGSLETHRKYVEDQLEDPHSLPCMMTWDGELMGYVEIVYTKEDHVAQHYPSDTGVGDWERGMHVLVGEAKYVGGGRAEIWIRSICHYMFLADPRTERVIGEPSVDNYAIQSAAMKAGYNTATVIDFPYKRSAIMFNPREKFFNLCRLR